MEVVSTMRFTETSSFLRSRAIKIRLEVLILSLILRLIISRKRNRLFKTYLSKNSDLIDFFF